mmetsp:Transcript_31448/g.31128  ORF Transcript_31448/g.31128 Transcript_31448/m.31128 type:complete len:279 (+) Transcript_31448:47-883(+)
MTIDEKTFSTLHALKISIWVGIFVGTITFGCGCDKIIPSYTASIIPLIAAFIILPITVQILLYRVCQNMRALSKQIIVSVVYNLACSAIIFAFLGCLLLDEAIDIPWAVVFIPVWYGMAILLLFIIFMFPGLTQSGYNRAAFLMCTWWIGVLTCTILWVCHLDYGTPNLFLYCWIPVFAAVLTHLIAYARERIQLRRINPDLPFKSREVFCVFILVPFTFVTMMKLYVLTWLPALFLVIPVAKLMVVWLFLEEKAHWGWCKGCCESREGKEKKYESVS